MNAKTVKFHFKTFAISCILKRGEEVVVKSKHISFVKCGAAQSV